MGAMGADELGRRAQAAGGRPYPALKALRGRYELPLGAGATGSFELAVDHVQGDPFAAPSRLTARVAPDASGLPAGLLGTPHARVAAADWLARRFSRALGRASRRVGGSGKSGLLATACPGPEVLPRSACEVGADGSVTLRLEAGLPAHGRTVDGHGLARMLCEQVPACVGEALPRGGGDLAGLRAAVELADDQLALRRQLAARGLVAFVADGSVLPRASGVSSRPLAGAVPFSSPASLRVTLDLPHRGPTPGMGVPRGVTLVVGGGYHGKSTLLAALQEGVYDHVAGDGRELVACDATAVKVRAEDGRPVRDVDISAFVRELPSGADTTRFSTEDASGSTSQAAAVCEALEAGAGALLMDEDTCATNLMVRDELMDAVVPAAGEPIRPFVGRVRGLWERFGVSSVVVVGSSGAFFPVADTVIRMADYRASDVTDHVREVLRERGVEVAPGALCRGAGRDVAPDVGGGAGLAATERRLALPGMRADGAASRGARGRGAGGRVRGPKVRARGLDELSVGEGMADVRLVEQLVDEGQVLALARMVRAMAGAGLLDGGMTPAEAVDAAFGALARDGWRWLAEQGEPGCDLVLPRRQELFAVLDRWRAAARG